MISYKVIRYIATIESGSGNPIRLTVMEWGEHGEKYDLRRWNGEKPMKGICLTADELKELGALINKELEND